MATIDYVVEFDAKALGNTCRIEVSLDLATRQSAVRIVFPSFSIGLGSLRELRDGIGELRAHAALVDSLPAHASTHRLRCSVSGASATVMLDNRQRAWYSISIGDTEQNGLLAEYDPSPLDELIATAEACRSAVLDTLARR